MIKIENRQNITPDVKKIIPLTLKGGGLFDQMGMGKTLQTITLINANKSTYKSFYKNGKLYSKATLLIVPTHLCGQWEREFEKHQESPITIIKLFTKHHYKKFTFYELMTADVVIVSSNFFVNCELSPFDEIDKLSDVINMFSKNVNIFKLYWYRVAIDEYHEMEKRDELFGLIKYIESDNRWIISGTPLKEHTISDNYYEEGHNVCYHRKRGGRNEMEIYKNILNESSIGQIINYLSWDSSAVLKFDFTNHIQYNYLLGHFSRNMQDNNVSILRLPKINEKIVWLNFSNTERMMYNAHLANDNNDMADTYLRKMCCHPMLCDNVKELVSEGGTFSLQDIQQKMKQTYLSDFERAKTNYDECKVRIANQNAQKEDLEKQGKTNLMAYTDILANITRYTENLKDLEKVMNGKRGSLEYYINFVEMLKDTAKIVLQECPICLDNIKMDDIGISSCSHMYCYTCIHTIITTSQSKACPTCNKHLKLNNIFAISAEKPVEEKKEESKDDDDVNKYGTKLAYLIKYIKSTPNKYRIIFSQWDDMLRNVGKVLDECGIKNKFCIGHGYQRDKVLRLFNSNDEANDFRVLMLSSNNNISGSNLSNAQEVIFIDPFYASKQERQNMRDQAIARVRRLGNNHETVDVIDLLIRNTVEENIYRHNCTEDKVEVKM
jgi:SNF2 family DNA or RNA helicase